MTTDADNNAVKGFNNRDAEAIVKLIDPKGGGVKQSRPSDRHPISRFVKIKTSISANTTGQAYYMEPYSGGWQTTADELTVWSPFAAVTVNDICFTEVINGRICAFKVCP